MKFGQCFTTFKHCRKYGLRPYIMGNGIEGCLPRPRPRYTCGLKFSYILEEVLLPPSIESYPFHSAFILKRLCWLWQLHCTVDIMGLGGEGGFVMIWKKVRTLLWCSDELILRIKNSHTPRVFLSNLLSNVSLMPFWEWMNLPLGQASVSC